MVSHLRKTIQQGNLSNFLLDAELSDQAKHIVVGHVVKRTNVLFLDTFAQIFRGNIAGFAIGQIASTLIAESDKRSVAQSHDARLAIYRELRVDGVRMARGNAVPHVGEKAL